MEYLLPPGYSQSSMSEHQICFAGCCYPERTLIVTRFGTSQFEDFHPLMVSEVTCVSTIKFNKANKRSYPLLDTGVCQALQIPAHESQGNDQ